MTTELLSRRTEGAVWLLTLNRPEKRNALSAELIRALTAAISSAAADDGVRVIVLTGAGPSFCAGLDLTELRAADAPAEAASRAAAALHALLQRISEVPKAVVAAVNGPAVAGGAALATACDLVVAAESARIGYPGIKDGLVAAVVMPPLVRQVGERRARFLLLTGELLSAAAAKQLGLVDEVVPDAELSARNRTWADQLAAYPPAAIAEMKRMFRQLRHLGPAADRDRTFISQFRIGDFASQTPAGRPDGSS